MSAVESAGDTIFALSTGAAPAAIAVIRISGPMAFAAVKALVGRLPEPRVASVAKLRSPATMDGFVDGNVIDEALLLIFPGPNSATGEDVAELHLHGGRAVVRAVQAALGAMQDLRPADAGEFTRRAFLNGRMGLNEAEGLSDLLNAETELQRRAGANMFGGAFSRAIEQWRNELLRISALTEAELDFSDEDDVDSQNKDTILNACTKLESTIKQLLSLPSAEKLRDGLRVVLAGPPNSGKSTLLNALVAREAAIVSDIAGTTRDVIEVPVSLGDMPFLFTDTAGVRDDSEDTIENIGIDRARQAFVVADMILWLGDEGAGPNHEALIEVETKSDLSSQQKKSAKAFWVSAKSGEGMTLLVADIIVRAKKMLPPPDSYAINMRQRRLLQDTSIALHGAAQSDDWLIVGEQLRQARRALDALTGRTHTEDLLDTLFGKFCVGK
jgi:tRNA modification GTPase